MNEPCKTCGEVQYPDPTQFEIFMNYFWSIFFVLLALLVPIALIKVIFFL